MYFPAVLEQRPKEELRSTIQANQDSRTAERNMIDYSLLRVYV